MELPHPPLNLKSENTLQSYTGATILTNQKMLSMPIGNSSAINGLDRYGDTPLQKQIFIWLNIASNAHELDTLDTLNYKYSLYQLKRNMAKERCKKTTGELNALIALWR